MRDDYVTDYLTRYRRFLGLSPLPEYQEKTPLITTLSGRSGLSDRQVRALLQAVFDNALNRMRTEGREAYEMDSLRAASSHWLRYTSATFDAPLRNAKDLQSDQMRADAEAGVIHKSVRELMDDGESSLALDDYPGLK